MRLVEYSSDDDDESKNEEEPTIAPLAPPALPALPSTFHDLYSGNIFSSLTNRKSSRVSETIHYCMKDEYVDTLMFQDNGQRMLISNVDPPSRHFELIFSSSIN